MKFKVLILLAVASGCSKKTTTDQNCIKYADVYVTDVQKSGAHSADVSFQVNSGCGQFNKVYTKE